MEHKAQELSKEARKIVLRMQRNELTEHACYQSLASGLKEPENQQILLRLAQEELKHHDIWKRYTGEAVKPNHLMVYWRKALSVLFGYTFVIKLMEKGEASAQKTYRALAEEVPEALEIEEEESRHENQLIALLDENRLQYVGSMVLGLNDALVELTGTLAGLSLALQNTRLIALSGLITGISATLSMASSEYLAGRSEGRPDALKPAMYTGVAYMITVALLILPYLLFSETRYIFALLSMLGIAILIILVFNYYVSVAKDLDFKKRFSEMVLISLGVAALSFVVGLLAKALLGIDI